MIRYSPILLSLILCGCDSTVPPVKDQPIVEKSETKSPVKPEPKPPEMPPKAKDDFRPPEIEEGKEEPPEQAPPIPETYKPLNKAKTIYFERLEDGTRRVHLMTEVCLREGPLEVLVCKNMTKEHESILHVDADGREIHLALVAAGATPGNTVRYLPEFKPPTGTKIKVSLTYREKGKVKTVPAQTWVKDRKLNADMQHEWVFAGSRLLKDPEKPTAPPFYTANNGEIISLVNFPDAMLDLPVKSPKDAAELIFEIQTARVPPVKTPVIVTMEPVVEKKK